MKTIRELHTEIINREKERGRDIGELTQAYQMDCLFSIAQEKDEKETARIKRDIKAKGQEKDEFKLSLDAAAVYGELVNENKKVYALIAPAFHGQFGAPVTPGKVRAALKELGFTGMVEVAVFADILTLKEALEFDRHVVHQSDFQLTSCCCPVWIAMIRGQYKELMGHVPGAVSPMIAAGRAVKKIHADAVTVFVGPCMAKKKEAREPDIADAVDYVLTFQEVASLFDAANIRPEEMSEDEKEHSSMAGRIYARTGGVSEAVQRTVEQLHPGRAITVRARQADGVAACRSLIEEIKSGQTEANFFEGMACQGGCVGGPKALLPKEAGRELVNRYGGEAVYRTPLENPYVIELIERLGFYTVEDFLEKSDILTRDFSTGK